MSQHQQILAVYSKGLETRDSEQGDGGDPAGCRYLMLLRFRILLDSDGTQPCRIDRRARCTGIEGQSQIGSAERPAQHRTSQYQFGMRIKVHTRRAYSMSSGISPVYTVAKRPGRSSAAFR